MELLLGTLTHCTAPHPAPCTLPVTCTLPMSQLSQPPAPSAPPLTGSVLVTVQDRCGASPSSACTEVASRIVRPFKRAGCLYFGLGLFVVVPGNRITPRWRSAHRRDHCTTIARSRVLPPTAPFPAIGTPFCRSPGAVVWLSDFSAVRSAKTPPSLWIRTDRGLPAVFSLGAFLSPPPQKARARGPLQSSE